MEKKSTLSKETENALLYFRPGSHSITCECETCEKLSEGYFSLFDQEGNYHGHVYERLDQRRDASFSNDNSASISHHRGEEGTESDNSRSALA